MDTKTTNSTNRIALVVAIAICLAGAAFLGAKAYMAVTTAPLVASVYNEEGIVPAAGKAGVDFEALASQNSDVCAWLCEDALQINTPVVKSQAKASFYQTHDAMGVKSADGAMFFNAYNAVDMSDAVTVFNVNEKSELGQKVLSYSSQSVFDESSELRVYSPGYVRTYQVVAAYLDDDQDILAKNNYFATYDDLSAFEDNLKDPDAVSSNVSHDVAFDTTSKFLVLSTYQTEALASGHFVVCGVLTDESAV